MAETSIYDDFEEPTPISRAFCQQVLSQEYSENVVTETDKALGELCLLLDKKPELYARVLRKRKREEIENDGVLSFMKSKVLSLVQGDEYTDNLVTDADCLRQTNALKAGMCRTFQYAQELKDEPVRHSQRQASKIASKRMEKLMPKNKRVGEKSKTNLSAIAVDNVSHKDGGDGQPEPNMQKPETESKRVGINIENAVEYDEASFEEILLFSKDDSNHDGSPAKLKTVSSGNQENDDNDNMKSGNVNESTSVPPPPGPPPPLPIHKTSNILQNLTPNVRKLTESFLSQSQTTPDVLYNLSSSDVDNSSGSPSNGRHRRNKESGCHQSKSDMAVSKKTPDDTMGRRLRSQKHSGSMASLSSVHSELISSNPVSRLKVTQIVRSPGGTPLRPAPTSRLPSEPLHKALVTAVKSKFKNVNTPSPRSALSSANNSGMFSYTP